MHKIDSENAGPSGTWLKSDSMIPRHATRGTANWFNSVQKELTDVIEAAGIALQASGEADRLAGFGGQLLAAIDKLSPVKAACVVKNDGGTPELVGSDRNVASVSYIASGGPKRFRVTFDEAIANPIAANITQRRRTDLGSDTLTVWPIIWELTSTHLDFYVHGSVFNSAPGITEWEFSNLTIEDWAVQYDVTVIGA